MNIKLRQTLDKLLATIRRPFRKHLILTGYAIKEDPARIEYYYKCPYCGYEFITSFLNDEDYSPKITSCLNDGFYCHKCNHVSIEPTTKNIYNVL